MLKKDDLKNIEDFFSINGYYRKNNLHRVYYLKDIFYDLYHNKGYGFKWISKYELNSIISNVMLKTLFEYLGIEKRKGQSVVTDNLRNFRREKALKEKKLETGFFNPVVQKEAKSKKYIGRGIQGYYYNKSKKKYVWLRSSWEYIYAKFLDKIKADWDVEVKTYVLKNGTKYRPDFFIFEDGIISKIIEIKGYQYREEKALVLNEEIQEKVILVKNIKPYIKKDSSLKKEVTEWKKKRILNLEN